jgi:hypothetical protein
MLGLHMPVTINLLKIYNEITPVYVSTEIHVYTCNHFYKVMKCDKYKINTKYGLLQGIFRGNSKMTFYLHGPDLASYPVTDYFRLCPPSVTLT